MKSIPAIFILVFSVSSLSAQWEPMNGPYGGFINDLDKNKDYQFVAAPSGLYRSDDAGQTWTYIEISPGIIYACLQAGVYNDTIITDAANYINGKLKRYLLKSNDNGNTWTELNRPETNGYLSISFNNSFIYATDFYNVWVSTDDGQTWKYSSINSVISLAYELQSFDGIIYINTKDELFKSSATEDLFEEIPLDLTIHNINSFYVDSNLLLVETDNGLIFRTENEGQSWTRFSQQLYTAGRFSKIGSSYFISEYGTVYKSDDKGKTWTNQHSSNLHIGTDKMISAGENLITSSPFKGLDVSSDHGLIFNAANKNISSNYVTALQIHNNELFTGCYDNGIHVYNFETKTWEDSPRLSTDSEVNDIIERDQDLYAIVGLEILKSSDHGFHWENIHTENLSRFENFCDYDNAILLEGISSFFIQFTQNDGLEWQDYHIESGGKDIFPMLFVQNGNTILTANYKTLFRSLDHGLTWDTAMVGISFESEFSQFDRLYSFNKILFATEYVRVPYQEHRWLYVSYDNGDHWQVSEDGIPTDSYPFGIRTLTNVDDILIASMINYGQGVYVSFDNAASWQPFYEGLFFSDTYDIIHDGEYLYAGTYVEGVWRRKISDLYTTSTHQPVVNNEISVFPNPSNGNFTLKIDSQFSGKAELVIYELNGKDCLTKQIVLGPQIEVRAETLPAGLYFLSVKSGDKVYSGKVVIQK